MTGRCPECGFDPDAVAPEEVAATVRNLPRRYAAPLTRFLPGEDGEALVRTRPDPATWSALEYAAHVADVLELFAGRVRQALAEDRPAFAVIDHEARAEVRHRDPPPTASVVAAVASGAESLAAALEEVPPHGWGRVGTRAGEERTVADVARRAAHEGHHHLLDIGRVLRTVRGR